MEWRGGRSGVGGGYLVGRIGGKKWCRGWSGCVLEGWRGGGGGVVY